MKKLYHVPTPCASSHFTTILSISKCCKEMFIGKACRAFMCVLIWLFSDVKLDALSLVTDGNLHNWHGWYIWLINCLATLKFSFVTGRFSMSALASPCNVEIRLWNLCALDMWISYDISDWSVSGVWPVTQVLPLNMGSEITGNRVCELLDTIDQVCWLPLSELLPDLGVLTTGCNSSLTIASA